MFWSVVKTLFLATGALLAITSYKSVPLAQTIRFGIIVYKLAIKGKPKGIKFTKEYLEERNKKIQSDVNLDLFKVTRYDSYCSPLECDHNMHKTNSSYLLELDLARTVCVLETIPEIFWYQQDTNTNKKGKGSMFNWPFVPLATISVSFLKEIKPMEKYHLETRILTWDEKWLFLLTCFKITKSGRTAAISIGKLVFKNGRNTVPPADVIKLSGLYNDKVEEIRTRNFKYVSAYVDQSTYDTISFD